MSLGKPKYFLKSIWNQVIEENDTSYLHSSIDKTTFKTHECHYKFLLMPFELTNATSTFRSLMNFIFETYLRMHVLMFFNNIVIYGKNKDLLQHLKKVFKTLRTHRLYVIRRKCTFDYTQIYYLRQILHQLVWRLALLRHKLWEIGRPQKQSN